MPQFVQPQDPHRVLLPVYTGGIRPVDQRRGIMPKMLVSSRYAVTWGRDVQLDFATRTSPRYVAMLNDTALLLSIGDLID
ncbi:hypothetical protein DL93DRAFT_2073568 [Clavulina sp. PMI_390]|nr:hypothetical protein DL93DRAFT_2073568 [Clavulina sp. PMI_390]